MPEGGAAAEGAPATSGREPAGLPADAFPVLGTGFGGSGSGDAVAGGDSSDESNDGVESDEEVEAGADAERERDAADNWMPERKKGAGARRLFRRLQKAPAFRSRLEADALHQLQRIRPDVGGLDERGEFVPLQYIRDPDAHASVARSSASVPAPAPVPAATAAAAATAATPRATLFPLALFARPSVSAPAAAAAAAEAALRHRVFDGPSFLQVSAPNWRSVSAARQLFYFRRILLGQAGSIAPPSSSAAGASRLAAALRALFCC